ncbi:MAG: hypothetical protein ACERLM_00785 [Acidimicrobiales bacterium]
MTSLGQRTRPSAEVVRWIGDGIDRRLLAALLVVDGCFLVAHGAHVYTTRVLDRSRWYVFALDRDQGLAEIWQYGKYAALVLVLALLAWRARSAVLGAWALAFGVLALDDIAELHERAGRALDDVAGSGEALGELGYLVVTGAALFAVILVAWTRSPVSTDRLARALVAMGAILVIVGIGADLLHALVDDNDWANEIGRVVEDGGALVVLSAIVAMVWGMRHTIDAG